ncbi:MAG: hypothetical protein ABII00_10645 [Elusimicrobiota bacterium]
MNDGMNEESSASALSKQLGIPYASAQNQVLKAEENQNLRDIVPAQFAREHEVFPLFRDGNTLAIAMVSPQDARLINELKRISGLDVEPFVAPRSQLLRAVDKFYGAGSGQGSGGTAGKPVHPPGHPPVLADAEAKDFPPDECRDITGLGDA